MIHYKTEYCKSGALTKSSTFRKISFLVMNICVTISFKKIQYICSTVQLKKQSKLSQLIQIT